MNKLTADFAVLEPEAQAGHPAGVAPVGFRDEERFITWGGDRGASPANRKTTIAAGGQPLGIVGYDLSEAGVRLLVNTASGYSGGDREFVLNHSSRILRLTAALAKDDVLGADGDAR